MSESVSECVLELLEKIIEIWDAYDKQRMELAKNEYKKIEAWEKENPNANFMQKALQEKKLNCTLVDKHDYHGLRMYGWSEMHERNIENAANLGEKLIARVEKKVGNITGMEQLSVTPGNDYGIVIDVIVEGPEGKVKVTTSEKVDEVIRRAEYSAYCIPKLSIKTLVKKQK